MRESDTVIALLGGSRALGGTPRTDRDFVELVRRGLPFASVGAAARKLGVSDEEALGWAGLPRRTMARRKAQGDRLKSGESERLLRLARAAALAIEVLGDETRAVEWLRNPNRGLGGEAPVNLLDTDVGTGAVLDELLRLEYGVFS